MEKEYLVTKISDRKEKNYQYFRNLKVNDIGYPLEEEIDKLASLEEDRQVVFLLADSEMSIVSFKNDSKLKKAVKNEYINNFHDRDFKSIMYRTKDEVKSSIETLLSLLEIKSGLEEASVLSKKIK